MREETPLPASPQKGEGHARCAFCAQLEVGILTPPMCEKHADFFMVVATMHRLHMLVSIESVTEFVEDHMTTLVHLSFTVDEIPVLMQQLADYIEEK